MPVCAFWLDPARIERMGTLAVVAPMATAVVPTEMNWTPSAVEKTVASGMEKAETTAGENVKVS